MKSSYPKITYGILGTSHLCRVHIRPFSPRIPLHFDHFLDMSIEVHPGDYFLIVAADSEHESPETDEHNNIATIPITIDDPDIDLVGKNMFADSSAIAGEAFNFGITVENIGNTTSGDASVGIYLSSDSTLDITDHYLGDEDFDPLGTGDSVVISGSATIPVFMDAGNYALLFYVDDEDRNPETDENNIGIVPFTVDPPDINLQALLIETDEFSISQGASIRVHFDFQNNGTSVAPGTEYRVLLSEDQYSG